MKCDAGWRRRNKIRHDNQPANKRQLGGEVDKRRQHVARQRRCVERTRGVGGATTGATQQPAGKQEANWKRGTRRQGALEHQEDKRQRRCNKRRCNNQPANKRQKGGRRQWTKRQQCHESWWRLKTTRAAVMLVDTLKGGDMVYLGD
jgi:hypothetical protein